MTQDAYSPPNPSLETSVEKPSPTMKQLLFSFEGRIPRRVFWGVTLGGMVVLGVAFGLGVLVLGDEALLGWMLVLYVPLIWVSLAIQCKRWHDRGKSAWWMLIGLIPIIGSIEVFVETGCLRGTVGSNQYGPDPT